MSTILSPVVQIPVELEKLFVVIEHELPGRDQLHEIAAGIGTEDGELPTGPELDTLLDAASGLTRHEWTGAEIRACCRLAALLDLPLIQAARNVVPVAVTAAEAVQRLRTWASGRCLSASYPGLYNNESTTSKSRRRVGRDSSTN